MNAPERCPVCRALLDEEDLFCPNCGAEAPQSSQPARPTRLATHNFQCSGCGASMSYDASAKALRCPFCASTDLHEQPDARILAPQSVVPFETDQRQAMAALRDWLGRGFWRPGDLAQRAMVVAMQPVYVPYWVCEARTFTYWTADTSQTPLGARADWYPLTGEHHGTYRGVLVGASAALTPKETAALCPFDLSRGLAPEQVDLDNITVEQFTVPRKYARPLARQSLDSLEAEACRKLVPGSCRNLKVNVRLEGLTTTPMLLPTWVMAYRYRNRVYRFLVNGQTARATGQAPISLSKILVAVAIALAVLALLAVLAAMASGAEPQRASLEPRPPLEARQAIDYFQVAPGLRVELVACEPQVIDPVEARFDEQGRLWVVEMRDYPNGPPPQEPWLSSIRLLEDHDGDGFYETSRVFADRLAFPTGLQPWRQGVIVTLAGRIAYLADTDGDGRADHQETWFTGFAEENPQLRANHPRFGPDNLLYVANGLRGGTVVSTRGGHAPVPIGGRDFRFDPHTLRGEAVSGHGQFGLAFDGLGARFVCSNRNPLVHVVLEDHYLARNPLLAVPTVVHDVAAPAESSRLFPISETWTTSILHANQFTAACGVHVYQGSLLPEYAGCGLTCDPTGNLVHAERMVRQGATFVSSPCDEGREFLASRDPWFRPVNLETGPEGALYVVDMYRAVIEHPEWVPEELKHRPDERHGDDRGRIWRIVPEEGTAASPAVCRLASSEPAALVELLDHANSWQRETAARLLWERPEWSGEERADISARLSAAARSARRPEARIRALWLLAGLERLEVGQLAYALDDAHPAVQCQALILAEPLLQSNELLRCKVYALAESADASVRFQTALTLSADSSDAALAPLLQIALGDGSDPWTVRAIAAASRGRAARLISGILQARCDAQRPNGASGGATRPTPLPVPGQIETLLVELASLVGASLDESEIETALSAAARLLEQGEVRLAFQLAEALTSGLYNRGGRLYAPDTQPHDTVAAAAMQVLAAAALVAADPEAEAAARAAACRLLAYGNQDAAQRLAGLVRSSEPQPLRLEALRSLARHSAGVADQVLLEMLSPRETPSVRRAAIEALLAQPGRTRLLLSALEMGSFAAAELDQLQARRLLEHPDPTLRAEASRLLTTALPADREQALASYRAALDLKGNARRGREVFRKHCTSCHRIGDLGVDVGPSIADERTKTPEQLLVDILQPSRAIDANYQAYTIVTTEGTVYTGIIQSETAASITLRLPEGKQASLLREELEEIRASGNSLMPDGLERNISLQEMADLIAFIKNWRYLDGAVPGFSD